METKPLLYGIIGFLLGGFLVSVVAVTIDAEQTNVNEGHSSMSMDEMNKELALLDGREFDQAYMEMMIAHHEGAIDMAGLAAGRAERQEIKDLSLEILGAQNEEIDQMRQWQSDWGFEVSVPGKPEGSHANH